MKTKIENNNLAEHVGKFANLYCQVGVLFSVQGTIAIGTLTSYKLVLSNGDAIGFSFGEFAVTENGSLSITIN